MRSSHLKTEVQRKLLIPSVCSVFCTKKVSIFNFLINALLLVLSSNALKCERMSGSQVPVHNN